MPQTPHHEEGVPPPIPNLLCSPNFKLLTLIGGNAKLIYRWFGK